MMIRVCIVLFLAAIALGVNPATAETILLKDGSRLSGKIVGADAESFQFQTPDGILTIRRESIESIGSRGSSPELPSTPADDSPVSPVVPAVFVAPTPGRDVWLPKSHTRSGRRVSPYFAGGYRSSSDEAN